MKGHTRTLSLDLMYNYSKDVNEIDEYFAHFISSLFEAQKNRGKSDLLKNNQSGDVMAPRRSVLF